VLLLTVVFYAIQVACDDPAGILESRSSGGGGTMRGYGLQWGAKNSKNHPTTKGMKGFQPSFYGVKFS
jgi:hypothetical protein